MIYNFIFKNILIFTLLLFFIGLLIILEVYNIIESKYIISVSDALFLINNNKGVIIDLRSDLEFKKCRIINSINLPFYILSNHLDLFSKYSKKKIILIASDKSQIRKILNKVKYNDQITIKYFKNGINEWIENGMPVKSDI